MKYSLSRNGQVIGSYTLEEIQGYVQAGRIVPSDFVLPEGGAQWVPVSTLTFPVATSAVASPPPPSTGRRPETHLVWSILVTLLCCLPLGIVAIVFSAQVDSKFVRGDYAGAEEASKRAAMFCWIAFGLGMLAVLFYVAAMILGAIANH